MKRFLAQAGKSTAGPSKKVKGTGAAAAQANAVAVPRDAANKLAHQLKQKEWTNLDSNGSAVLYWPRLLSSISKRVLSSLLQEVPWEQVWLQQSKRWITDAACGQGQHVLQVEEQQL